MQPAVEIAADLTLSVQGPAHLAFQLMVAGGAGTLDLSLDGEPVGWTQVHGDVDGRTQVLDVGPGELVVRYRATLPERPQETAAPTALDRLVYTRPSRYCPSDLLGSLPAELLGLLPDDDGQRALAVADWVHGRTAYVGGSSGPTDGALETLLRARGVCRDFAHLLIAACRAVDVPARMVAVYAPGLFPMDFHAVVEVAVQGRWQVLDATRLAPRQSLVRIATGRDAADTAFLTNIGGPVDLLAYEVRALTQGDLPTDDGRVAVVLA